MVGLEVSGSSGPVSLFGVSASGNRGDGVTISAVNNAVTVKDSVFDRNDEAHEVGVGDGLYIYSNTVTLENIQANNNGMRGIISYANSSFTGKHLHTDGNQSSGVEVVSCFDYLDGDAFCDNTGAGTVTITNSGVSSNHENGYAVYAKGAVTISSVYSGDNDWDGIYVENASSPAAPAVTITDVTTARNENGINLNVKGAVTLKDIHTSDNRVDGVNILSSGTGAVTITYASNMFNESWGNGENGYEIVTKGPVTVTNFDVHDNGLLGGSVDNSGAATAAAVTVNVLGTSEYYNDYLSNGTGGLEIRSRGVVTVSKVMVNDNGGSGLYINNLPPGTAAGVAVTVSDATFERNGAFGEAGLKISSKGAITLMNILANDNGGVGALLDNKLAGGTAGVTINAGSGKGNEFQGNKLGGLIVHSNGAVTITNIYSANNGMDSTELSGDFSITTHLLFEPTRNFELAGLVIYQDKNNFFQFGRAYCDLTGPCSGNALYFDYANDVNVFGENYDTAITSTSEVYLRLTRDGQTITGWYSEDNATWVSIGSHTMAPDFQVNGVGLTSAQDFYREELVPQTPADFDFFDLSSPATHDSFTDDFSQNWLWVNENGSNWNLSENPGYLRIYASQSQTGGENLLVLPTTAGYGLYIDNIGGTGAVTLKQVGGWGVRDAWAEGNVFSNNSAGGLNILTKGAVTVAFFQARDNWNTGIQIDADGGTGAVSVTGTSNNWENMIKNRGDGINISAKGNITISKIHASSNRYHGATLDNHTGTGNVTLTDTWFDNNTHYGLNINTLGTVTWTNGSADGNGLTGAYILDQGTGKAVTIKNVYANHNGQTGLFVLSKGAVTMTEVEGNDNSVNNYYLDYGEEWIDNLTSDQVWYFGSDSLQNEHVIIELSSSRFTPSIVLYGPDGNFVDWIDGSDGYLWYDFIVPADVPSNKSYTLYVNSDNYDYAGFSYDLKLYTYDTPIFETNWDDSNGIKVDNQNGTGAVSISNSSNRWFGNNSGTGVLVVSSGAVTLKGMDLNDSSKGGAWIDNIPLTGTSAPGVTLTSVNFYNNDLTSASITTRGAVTVKTSDQSGNRSYGFWVDNTDGNALSPITFTDVGLHNWGTADTGVYLRSDGAVTLTNVTSNGNVASFGNMGAGFDIDAAGAVKFTLVNGYGNDGNGAHVVTDSTFTVVGSTSGATSFTYNSGTGLLVEAGGAISLTKVYTGDNGRDRETGNPIGNANGIYLDNTYTPGTPSISLSDVTSNNNTLEGLHIETYGAVTVNTLKVENNTEYGLYLDQTGAPR